MLQNKQIPLEEWFIQEFIFTGNKLSHPTYDVVATSYLGLI